MSNINFMLNFNSNLEVALECAFYVSLRDEIGHEILFLKKYLTNTLKILFK